MTATSFPVAPTATAVCAGQSTTSWVTERYPNLQDQAAAMEGIGDHYKRVTAIGIEAAKWAAQAKQADESQDLVAMANGNVEEDATPFLDGRAPHHRRRFAVLVTSDQ